MKYKWWVLVSDNFSFQNNGIKKCTCWKTMGFYGNQWVFKSNVFDITSHMIYFDYKAYSRAWCKTIVTTSFYI